MCGRKKCQETLLRCPSPAVVCHLTRDPRPHPTPAPPPTTLTPPQAAKGAKAYEKAEDPIYALRNNLPIDSQARAGVVGARCVHSDAGSVQQA